MTAAIVWSILILVGSGLYLAGEATGRRRERIVRDRIRRRRAEDAYEQLTIALALADPADLAWNEGHNRAARTLEVVR